MEDFTFTLPLRPLTLPDYSEDVIAPHVRFDDHCRNGHQSFGLTASIYGPQRIRGEDTVRYNGRTYWCNGGGCCHDAIVNAYPELTPFVKWHLSSTNGPMHYIANGIFWFELWQASQDPEHLKRKDEYLQKYSTAQLQAFFCKTVVLEAPPEGILSWNTGQVTAMLQERLPQLLTSFLEDMKKLRTLCSTF